ncbi:hypothetical protein [Microbacterium sp. YJN-G]|uniref:hypothetical protein n=1 Tax=Microbacterium sp. YJN-G TaxID=2763257 RepID=UPI001878F756|nr:hypothetical protein [Microbacterium sp. YJN-G]
MTNRSETKTITIPLHVWGQVASEADHRGVKVEDVLVGAINSVRLRSHRQAVVIGLTMLGHSDRVIAELTGEARDFIKQARRSVGLPANTSERKRA